MKITHLPVNFRDDRGTILDIFVGESHEHCTIITTKKGGVRGNHYHKLSRQQDFLVSGSMEIYSKEMPDGRVSRTVFEANDLVAWEPNEAHEFVAIEDSIFLTFVNGLRGGKDFEQDTIRLDTPLHEQFSKQTS